MPDKKHRLETKIKRRTLNPRWNETFYFEGFPIQKLNTRVLHLHVFDYDRFSRDDSIGEVFLPLCQVSGCNPSNISIKHRHLYIYIVSIYYNDYSNLDVLPFIYFIFRYIFFSRLIFAVFYPIPFKCTRSFIRHTII